MVSILVNLKAGHYVHQPYGPEVFADDEVDERHVPKKIELSSTLQFSQTQFSQTQTAAAASTDSGPESMGTSCLSPRYSPMEMPPSEGPTGSPYGPSPLVLLRRVHWSVTSAMVEDVGRRYGEVVRAVMLRSQDHVLLEFAELEDAQRMVESSPTVVLGGHAVAVGYCKHQRWISPNPSASLLVSFFDTDSPLLDNICVTPGFVYQIFAPYGAVERIVVVPKKSRKNRMNVLVQFASAEHAATVKEKLQGLPVWIGGKTQMAVDLLFAKMDVLSCDYMPETSLAVPLEFVTVHKEMIDKYGSLVDAFGVSAEDMSLEQLEDFQRFSSVLRQVTTDQRPDLDLRVQQLRGMVDDLPRLEAAVGEMMRSLHRPVVAKANAERAITPEAEQALLTRMHTVIATGGMASTSRLAVQTEEEDVAGKECVETVQDVNTGVTAWTQPSYSNTASSTKWHEHGWAVSAPVVDCGWPASVSSEALQMRACVAETYYETQMRYKNSPAYPGNAVHTPDTTMMADWTRPVRAVVAEPNYWADSVMMT
eukprot:Hpha_TRINITY_DN16851_c1_g3::TRINITY_DN16851_c1_g3_i2::g.151340::m.151340